jgi:hypothetical protein
MAAVKNICLEALERHCASGDVGQLDFRRGEYSGQIFTRASKIVHASLAGLEGVPALFRLFDWGDAETTWLPGQIPDQETLNLTMEEASLLYAESLQERADLEEKEKQRIDPALLAPEVIAGQQGGIESVLKNYTISLECSDKSLLPDGFMFSDASKSSYVIGSADECDLILRNPSIDPLHCGVILEKGSVLIWDLGAQSGVKINGTAVTQDVLKVGDVMTLGTLDLRVRFQIRRPTMKVKPMTTPLPEPTITPTGTAILPKVPTPSKEIPKGAITYDKVVRQLKRRTQGVPFLEKLSSLFGTKKDK